MRFRASRSAKRGLVTGFVDAGASTNRPIAGERATWFDRTVEPEAGIVRLHVFWAAVAGLTPPPDPTNPGERLL